MVESDKKDQARSTKGVAFGTGIEYDDAYGDHGDGGSEFVSSLPTDEEERRFMNDDGVRAREEEELNDTGRISQRKSSRGGRGQKVSTQCCDAMSCKESIALCCLCGFWFMFALFARLFGWLSSSQV